MVNVTDGKIIRLLVEDEPLDIHRGRLESHERTLDLRAGTLTRELQWRSDYRPRGQGDEPPARVVHRSQRRRDHVSRSRRSSSRCASRIQSNLQANQTRSARRRRPARGQGAGQRAREPARRRPRAARRARPPHPAQRAVAVRGAWTTLIEADSTITSLTQDEPDLGRVTVVGRARAGPAGALTKFLAYHWSSVQSVGWLRDQVDAASRSRWRRAGTGSPPQQRKFLDDYWDRADVDSRATPSSSRRCASRCSTCSRPRRASRAAPSRPRGSPAPATTGTRSGTPRASCCRC